MNIVYYEHKIPVTVLAGFPEYRDDFDGSVRVEDSTRARNSFIYKYFNRTLAMSTAQAQAAFSAFCERFCKGTNGALFVDKSSRPYKITAQKFGVLVDSFIEGTTTFNEPIKDTECFLYLQKNGLAFSDLIAVFEPVTRRHARIVDELNKYNAENFDGGEVEDFTENGTGQDTKNDNSTENVENTSKEVFNGINPTTARTNAIEEFSENRTGTFGSTYNRSSERTYQVKRSSLDERLKGAAALAESVSPITELMNDIALLLDDNVFKPLTEKRGFANE